MGLGELSPGPGRRAGRARSRTGRRARAARACFALAVAGRGGGLVGVPGGLDLAELLLLAGGAQFLGDVLGRPGGLGLVRAAAGEELAVGQVAHVDALHAGHDRERGVPFRPCLGVAARGFGADRLAGVVPAGDLPVGAELPGLALPLRRAVRGRRGPGRGPGWPTTAVLARRARRCGAAGRPSRRRPRPCTGPAPGRRTAAGSPPRTSRALGGRCAGRLADPGVQHRGVRPCAGERPAGDRRPDDFGAVQPGQLGGADGAPQHVGVLEDLLGVGGAGVVADRLGVPAVGLGAALVHPDRVQRAEVVGVRQRLLPGLGRRQLGVVAADDRGQDRDRVLAVQGRAPGRRFRGRPGACAAGRSPGRARAAGRSRSRPAPAPRGRRRPRCAGRRGTSPRTGPRGRACRWPGRCRPPRSGLRRCTRSARSRGRSSPAAYDLLIVNGADQVALAAGLAGPDQPGDGQVGARRSRRRGAGRRWPASARAGRRRAGCRSAGRRSGRRRRRGRLPAAPRSLPGWSWPQSSR